MDFDRLIPELDASHFEKSLFFHTGILGFQNPSKHAEK
jgi:hypothetical protein